MKSLRYEKEIYSSMTNIVDEYKAHQLDSVSVVRCYWFLLRETVFREKVGLPSCHCFRCCLKNLLREMILERDEQRMLFVITVSNFDDYNNNEVFCKLLTADNFYSNCCK